MDPTPEVHPIAYTNSTQPKNRIWIILIILFALLSCLVGFLFLVNNLFFLKNLKLSCMWSSDLVSNNSLKNNFTIPENSTLPANKSETIGTLIESKYPVLAWGKVAVFYSPLDVKGRRIWSQLLFTDNNNHTAGWILAPLKQNYLYYLNYANDSNLTKEGYYYFALINNNKVIAHKTCTVADKVLETGEVMPKSDILKYVK